MLCCAALPLLQGLYTEMDFRNEALNAQRMQQLLDERCVCGGGGLWLAWGAGAGSAGAGSAALAGLAAAATRLPTPSTQLKPAHPPVACPLPTISQRVLHRRSGHPAAAAGPDDAARAHHGVGHGRQADDAGGGVGWGVAPLACCLATAGCRLCLDAALPGCDTALCLRCPPPCPQPAEVRQLVKVGQEAFLTQLLDVGFFHG